MKVSSVLAQRVEADLLVRDDDDLRRQLESLHVLHRVSVELNASRDLSATLQLVVDSVVASLGFGAAAINLVRGEVVEVAAVAGSEELLAAALVGRTGPKQAWEERLASAHPWGTLRFHEHGELRPDLPTWVPERLEPTEPDAWHPEDALFAPLYRPDGELIGVLSVDLPVDGRRPGKLQCELLEMFAAQAENAIDNARLQAELTHGVESLEREKRALRASEESFRASFENAPSGMAMAGPTDSRLARVNSALGEMLGYPTDELVGTSLVKLAHPGDRDLLPVGNQSYHGDVRLLHKSGRVVWVSMNSSTIPAPGEGSGIQLIHVEDISERHYREEQLAHLAAHEPLTGLPNRAELRARLGQLLNDGARLAVLYCDLDQFKQVNDRYGHHAGDEVLIEIAGRLRSHVRKSDTVARVGGDEFVLVLRDVDPTAAAALAERVASDVARPISLGDYEASVTASIGVAPVTDNLTVDEVLRRADRAMYDVKKAPRRAAPADQRVRVSKPGNATG